MSYAPGCGCLGDVDGSVGFCPRHAAVDALIAALQGLVKKVPDAEGDCAYCYGTFYSAYERQQEGEGKPPGYDHSADCPIVLGQAALQQAQP